MSVKFTYFMHHIRPIFPCWFCLDDLFIDVSGVLKSPINIDYCQSLPLLLLIFVVIFRWSYIGCIIVYKYYIILLDWSLYDYIIPLCLVLKSIWCFKIFVLKSIWCNYCYPSFFFPIFICLFPCQYHTVLITIAL